VTVDYKTLRAENVRRYGTDIGRIGGMLLANRYDKRTHFIYELLQNAEDALRRRKNWKGSRSVAFDLTEIELVITHFGEPFNEPDVRGVCGIDESTKDITSIGRFGIGFKSVYAFTERPQIHSGEEAFAIESYVWPAAVASRRPLSDQTMIVLPLEARDLEARAEIVEGLKNLGARTLLFLRNVKEISWTAPDGAFGLYFRDDPIWHGPNVREVSLMGQQQGGEEIAERWLVFSQEVHNDERPVGHVEVAFSLADDLGSAKTLKVEALADSTLVVFFPTVLPTNTGFLIQGPYRTTPSRDNVPLNDRWNKHLVGETGDLLAEALHWLRERKMLDANALKCLPLERAKFTGDLLAPLFDRVVEALSNEALLPCSDQTYASAADVQLSRTQDLRDLIQPEQLGMLLARKSPVKWLSSDITADRTPALRQYLLHELKLSEQTPEMLLPRLDKSFLQAQPDEWIIRLYEFLNKLPALADRLEDVPIVRLEEGVHVPAFIDGQPQAFLPNDKETGFPTVRRSVCAHAQAKSYLQSLKLTEPDPVDDVIRNLLPKYQSETPKIDHYAADIARMLRAFKTDSTAQKEKLISSLKETRFVMAREMADGSARFYWPELTYLSTARIRDLFQGISRVYVVDDSQDCLRGEDVREFLEACGAARYIYPVEAKSTLSDEQKYKLRLARGHVNATYERPIGDYDLRGLPALLRQLPTLPSEGRKKKARLLWEALIELQDRRGQSVFSGSYSWQYHQWRSASFDSLFIRRLNESAWVPDTNGDLHPPSSILFESLNWSADPFLLSKIQFKKPIVEELAREAGFEPGVLDILKRLGLTNTADLMARLNIDVPDAEPDNDNSSDEGMPNDVDSEIGPTNDVQIEEATERSASQERNAASLPARSNGHENTVQTDQTDTPDPGETSSETRASGASRSDREPGQRAFISYVAAHPEDDDDGLGGLNHSERMALESRAIEFIRLREPTLKAMPAGNKGFDLIETDANDEPERWIEVKAMKGCLEDRPVGLSNVQFEFARMHGEQYWLYVVEYADVPKRARIVKIQNPAGRTGTFTFDKGWISIADVDDASFG
jgi:hypothetical protein